MEKEEYAKDLVIAYLEELNEETFDPQYIKVVWFCKTLRNWKAMIADTTPGGLFFEVTHNGNDNETYLDAYRKVENRVIPD